MKYLHDRKIIHRDIKSKNIFVTKKGLVNLGDFGISCVCRSQYEKRKSYKGTVLNMAPEIIKGKEYSFPADLWSLGIVLYRLCALNYPWSKES